MSDSPPTRSEVVRVVREAAPTKLSGREIYEKGSFESQELVYVALSDLSRGDGSALVREKPGVGGRFIYGIRPGVDLEKYLLDGTRQTRRRAETDDPPPGPPLRVAPPRAERPASPTWPKDAEPKLAQSAAHHTVLLELKAKLSQQEEECVRLRNTIAALEEIYGK